MEDKTGDRRIQPDENRRTCLTRDDLVAAFGGVCSVVGTYDLLNVAKKRSETREWPVVVLDDGTRVLIESPWDATKQPSAELIALHRGHRVEVVGTLHQVPPGGVANMSVPCLAPVESLRILPR